MRTRRIRLWGGTLVIKHRERLSFDERQERVPVLPIGNTRLIWWSDTAAKLRDIEKSRK